MMLEEITQVIAAKVAEAFRGDAVLIAQKDSPLGRNRHCAAVRRRMAEGLDGAYRVGKSYLLTPAALREEMGRLGMPSERPPVAKAKPAQADDDVARFRAELDRALEACK